MTRKKTRVPTITCPQCKIEMYSRAPHDYRACHCGTMIDGGFSGYLRYGWPDGCEKPAIRHRYINATRRELYDDWNTRANRFGIIKPKGAQ